MLLGLCAIVALVTLKRWLFRDSMTVASLIAMTYGKEIYSLERPLDRYPWFHKNKEQD